MVSLRAITHKWTMVIQNLHLGKLQSTLYGKENKKKTDETRLFPDGKGQHLTNNVLIAQLESAAMLKENKATARQQHQLECVAKEAAAGKEKAAWQQPRNGHKVKVAAWEDEWDHLLQVNPQMPKKAYQQSPRLLRRLTLDAPWILACLRQSWMTMGAQKMTIN